MTPYTLYHGDCLDILPTLEAQSVDAVIADPPYGTTACKWDSVIPFALMWSNVKRLVKRHSPVVLFGSEPFSSLLRASNIKQYRYDWVWDKGRGFNPQLANVQPMKCHEMISVFSKLKSIYYPQKVKLATPDDRTGRKHGANRKDGSGLSIISSNKVLPKIYTDRFPVSILQFDAISPPKRLHPSEKPIKLMEYLVKTYTNEGDTVLDFTMGSGTTGHACGNLGRRFIGIEKDAGYFAIAQERIAGAYEPLRMMQQVG